MSPELEKAIGELLEKEEATEAVLFLLAIQEEITKRKDYQAISQDAFPPYELVTKLREAERRTAHEILSSYDRTVLRVEKFRLAVFSALTGIGIKSITSYQFLKLWNSHYPHERVEFIEDFYRMADNIPEQYIVACNALETFLDALESLSFRYLSSSTSDSEKSARIFISCAKVISMGCDRGTIKETLQATKEWRDIEYKKFLQTNDEYKSLDTISFTLKTVISHLKQ
jgi:hypothetical protein